MQTVSIIGRDAKITDNFRAAYISQVTMQLPKGLEFFLFLFLVQTENGLSNGNIFMFVCLCMGSNGFELSGWHLNADVFFNLPLLDGLFVVVAIVVLLLLCVSSTAFQKALAGGRNKNDISLI